MRQTLALLFTAQCAVCMRVSSLRPQTLRTRHVAVIMADSKGGLPPGIADRLSFQTGGSKVARQEEEALILWNLVKECYPSEEAAVAAVDDTVLASTIGAVVGQPVTVVTQKPQRSVAKIEVPFVW